MERHFSRFHPDEFLKIGMEKERLLKCREDGETAKKKRKKEVSSVLNGVQLSMQKIKDALVKLVTQDGRPFSVVEDEGMQDIIKPLLAAVPSSERVAVSAESIRAEVLNKAQTSRQQIREEVAGKLISLKVDAVTRMNRSFLGVNIQYIKDGKLVLKTLAVKELKERHTAQNLERVILDIIWDYGISVENVYSITCDNGSNMVKAAALLKDTEEQALVSREENAARVAGNNVSNRSSEAEEDEADQEPDSDTVDDDVTNQEESDSGDAEYNYSDNADEPEESYYQDTLGDCLFAADDAIITCVRCAAHVLQLSVSDALKEGNCRKSIAQMRKLCKKLRTQNVVLLYENLKLKRPSLDVETRWHSTADMLLSLLPLREFCKEYNNSHPEKLFVTEATWNQAENIARALEPAKIATKQLQHEQLLVGDLYGVWLTCKLSTGAVDSPLSKLLVSKMEAREHILLQNEAFLAAVYMDPRYFSMLSPNAINTAEVHLQKVWKRIERLQLDQAKERREIPNPSISADPIRIEDASPLEKLLAEKDAERFTEAGGELRFNVLPELKTFRAIPRLPISANLLKFWETRRFVMPQLFDLAMVVLAVPATQVSVERVFSGVRFILSDLRFNLSSKVLDDIMVIRYQYLSEKSASGCENSKPLTVDSEPASKDSLPSPSTVSRSLSPSLTSSLGSPSSSSESDRSSASSPLTLPAPSS